FIAIHAHFKNEIVFEQKFSLTDFIAVSADAISRKKRRAVNSGERVHPRTRAGGWARKIRVLQSRTK
ncbi:MAG: hypothetical protein PHP76_06985, partial [Bacteroidales bacterium]|nr:hypothetical protein [Bacteroidales bacterium]